VILINYAVFEVSTAVFFASSVALGCGFGLSLKGAFQTLAGLTNAEERAEVISAAYIVIYLALSIPVILAGLGSTYLGLQIATLIFTAIVALLALVAGATPLMGEIRRASQGSHR
jgi:hypothetical protein